MQNGSGVLQLTGLADDRRLPVALRLLGLNTESLDALGAEQSTELFSLRCERGGQIALLHDGDHRSLGGDRAHVVTALEYWLPRWRDQGLEFVTIDQVGGPTAEAR